MQTNVVPKFYDAIFFDMDGLLINSEPLWLESETEMMAAYGYQWLESDQAACLGGPLDRVGNYMSALIGGKRDGLSLTNEIIERMVQKFKGELPLMAGSAELIADLVTSITKIPNPIKRSVFYQEVAKMLQIDENILINEGNKYIKTKIGENKRLEKGDGGIISPAPPVRNQELEIIDSLKKFNAQEESLVKDLVLYGHFVIEKDEETGQNHTLADYLFHETNDLKIETPIFHEIYQLYKTEYLNGSNPTTQMFSSNPNPQIQDIAVSWMSPKHELSDKWNTFEIFIPKYEEMLNEFSYKMVLRIRKEKIQKEIESLINEIDESSEEDLEIIMNTIGKKRGIIKLIAEELGSVV